MITAISIRLQFNSKYYPTRTRPDKSIDSFADLAGMLRREAEIQFRQAAMIEDAAENPQQTVEELVNKHYPGNVTEVLATVTHHSKNRRSYRCNDLVIHEEESESAANPSCNRTPPLFQQGDRFLDSEGNSFTVNDVYKSRDPLVEHGYSVRGRGGSVELDEVELRKMTKINNN